MVAAILEKKAVPQRLLLAFTLDFWILNFN